MGKDYRAKVFKSGNSLALRLPKALGLTEGAEMTLRGEAGKFAFEPAEPERRTIDVSGFWGKLATFDLPPRGDFEERPSASLPSRP